MVIDNKFNFGDIVYLKTDDEQQERIVTGMMLRYTGVVIYELSCGATSSNHYDFEISEEINNSIKVK